MTTIQEHSTVAKLKKTAVVEYKASLSDLNLDPLDGVPSKIIIEGQDEVFQKLLSVRNSSDGSIMHWYYAGSQDNQLIIIND